MRENSIQENPSSQRPSHSRKTGWKVPAPSLNEMLMRKKPSSTEPLDQMFDEIPTEKSYEKLNLRRPQFAQTPFTSRKFEGGRKETALIQDETKRESVERERKMYFFFLTCNDVFSIKKTFHGGRSEWSPKRRSPSFPSSNLALLHGKRKGPQRLHEAKSKAKPNLFQNR